MAHYRPVDADYALEADAGDEELPAPHESDPRWVRRLRRPAYAVLVLTAAAVTALQLRDPRGPGAAASDSTPAPVAEVTDAAESPASQLVRRAAYGLVSDDLADACPADRSCRTSPTLSAANAAALQAAFPGHADVTAHTVSLSDGGPPRLLGRFLHTSTPTADITVQVAPGPATTASVQRSGTGASTIVVVRRSLAGTTITVTVGGPAASDRPGTSALRLAADVRLTTLP